MMKRMSMVARQERRRLKEFLISLLASTMIEIMFPKIPRIPTIVWQMQRRLIYKRIKFLLVSLVTIKCKRLFAFLFLAISWIAKLVVLQKQGSQTIYISTLCQARSLKCCLNYLPEARPQASRHTGQRSAELPHPFGTGFRWVWKCRLDYIEDNMDKNWR